MLALVPILLILTIELNAYNDFPEDVLKTTSNYSIHLNPLAPLQRIDGF